MAYEISADIERIYKNMAYEISADIERILFKQFILCLTTYFLLNRLS